MGEFPGGGAVLSSCTGTLTGSPHPDRVPPHPDRAGLRIDPSAKQASIFVFTMEGRLILHFRELQNEGKIAINGRELLPGMYLYSLVVDGSEIDTKRMILTE